MEEEEEMEGKKGRKLGRVRRRATPNIILHESQSSHNHCPFSDSPAYGQFVAIDVTDRIIEASHQAHIESYIRTGAGGEAMRHQFPDIAV